MNKTSVVCIIFNNYGQVLIGKKIKNINDSLSESWHFIGGALEEGEDINEALKREVKEETNLYLNGADLFYKGKTKKNTTVYWFVSNSYLGEIKAGSDITELQWCSIDDILDVCKEASTFWGKEIIEMLYKIRDNKFTFGD